jgi:putative sigma-54 modulation protein
MLPPIQITGHGLEISATLRDFVNEKFAHLGKYVEQVISIHVILAVDKLQQVAEARMHIPHNEIYAKAESEDMYKAIDILINKLSHQLEKYKGKHEDRRRRGL